MEKYILKVSEFQRQKPENSLAECKFQTQENFFCIDWVLGRYHGL
jgi:hypothetical protein